MRVLICGAGIAGPTLAHFLSRFGTQVTVVEKASGILTQGQNIDIHGTALNIINKMGLLTELRKRNTTEKGTRFLDENRNAFATFPLEGTVRSLTSEFEILRGDLADLLYQATREDRNIDYRFGTTVTEVVENSEEKVKVKLSNGKEEEYDILVAADGQWSRIRKAVFDADTVQVVDKGCYSVYATVPRTEADSDYWDIYQALGSRAISTRPDNHGTLRVFITVMGITAAQKTAWDSAARSHDRKIQLDLIRSEFADLSCSPIPRLLDGLAQAPDLYFQTVSQIRLSKWHKNRVICLGDSAYAPTPFTGMGTSLAINGAYLLAGHLSQVQKGEHPRKAFEEYEKEFKPFVQEVQNVPWFVPGIAHPQYALTRWLFKRFIATMAWVAKIPFLVRRYGPKDKKLPEGLVDELDAPYPTFGALEAEKVATA
ncbi:hypothetical protein NDA16_001340 [Ustilago loliicola]|nr:hypothetical protein NDA16_001340 [Ustilago loliicola]